MFINFSNLKPVDRYLFIFFLNLKHLDNALLVSKTFFNFPAVCCVPYRLSNQIRQNAAFLYAETSEARRAVRRRRDHPDYKFELMMEALGGGGFLGWSFSHRKPKPFKSQSRKSKPSDSAEATGGTGYRFPLKQAATAGSLAFTGDTIAQLIQRWRKQKASEQQHSLSRSEQSDEVGLTFVSDN